MSAALCQLGAAAGACASCTPGTFRCNGTELDKCTDAGQYTKQEECPTAALCKAEAGQCTDLLCMPNAATCSADGSTLNTCNADGSAFADQKSCNGKGCNQSSKSCNTCTPGEKMCSGNSLATCAADGQTMTMTECTATGDCATASCQNNACTKGTKPLGSSCSVGKKCDASGSCVTCLADQDCPAPGPCEEQGRCVGGGCQSPRPKAAGTPCLSGMQCDGAGQCMQKPCGNRMNDPGEECDESADGWTNSGGACVNCKLTADAYQACRSGGGECWPGSTKVGWICSGAGACTRGCNGSSDCRVSGVTATCVNAPQRICVLQNCNECRNGTRCNFYGDEGQTTAVPMCGWVSVDTKSQPWCPHEYQTCCSPWGTCFKHPCTNGGSMWPMGCNF